MQRIWSCALTVEQYVELDGAGQVRGELVCPRCSQAGGLHRHGTYERGITTASGQAIRVRIARFLCRACRRTISYLPAFALSYRLVQAGSFEAYLDERFERPDVRRWEDLLRGYRRRMLGNAEVVVATVGCGFGRDPPKAPGLWPWLRETCGDLAVATRQLVTLFQITLFRRYQCHQPTV